MMSSKEFSRIPAGRVRERNGSLNDASGSYDVVVTRGGMVESRHRVHVAVVDATGSMLIKARNPRLVTWWRSCAKPFQAMPFVRSGGPDELSWDEECIALACASHGGEPEHVELARRMLESAGASEDDLACGPHEPLTRRGVTLLRESAMSPGRLHNNCSGKHAAMIAYARKLGAPIDGYHAQGHPVQEKILATVSEWTGLPPTAIRQGTDGCGVVVFGLPLYNMALSYARLCGADDAPARIVNAILRHPFLVGGTGRFDTVLMSEMKGRVLCKIGAEGVHTVGLPGRGIGIALKVECGSARAQYPALLAVLGDLGVFPDGLPAALREFAVTTVTNTRGEDVGEITVERTEVQ